MRCGPPLYCTAPPTSWLRGEAARKYRVGRARPHPLHPGEGDLGGAAVDAAEAAAAHPQGPGHGGAESRSHPIRCGRSWICSSAAPPQGAEARRRSSAASGRWRDAFSPYRPTPVRGPTRDHLFFGRERETDGSLRLLRTHRFIGDRHLRQRQVVVGALRPDPIATAASWSRAGSDWRVAILRPATTHRQPGGGAGSRGRAGRQMGELAEAGTMLLETTLRRSALGLADCVRHARLAPPPEPAGGGGPVRGCSLPRDPQVGRVPRRGHRVREAAARRRQQDSVPVYGPHDALRLHRRLHGVSGPAEAVNRGQH